MSEILADKTRELVAIAASVACNCEPCLKYHYDAAKKAGCTADEMTEAVSVGRRVKQAPVKAMDDLAERLGLKGE
jgi:AhpD family alkylhydroperoxidase